MHDMCNRNMGEC